MISHAVSNLLAQWQQESLNSYFPKFCANITRLVCSQVTFSMYMLDIAQNSEYYFDFKIT